MNEKHLLEPKSPATHGQEAAQQSNSPTDTSQVMAAHTLDQLDRDMAAGILARLAEIDRAIALLQEIRGETQELFAEIFPEAAHDCQSRALAGLCSSCLEPCDVRDNPEAV